MRLSDLNWITRHGSSQDPTVSESVTHMSAPVQGTTEALHSLIRAVESDPLVASRVEGEFDSLAGAFADSGEEGKFHLLSVHISDEAPLRVVIDHSPMVAGHCPVCVDAARKLDIKVVAKVHPRLKLVSNLNELEQLPYPPAPGLTQPGDILIYVEGQDIETHLEGALHKDPTVGSGSWSVSLGGLVDGVAVRDPDGLTVRSISTVYKNGSLFSACIGMHPIYFEHSLWSALV